MATLTGDAGLLGAGPAQMSCGTVWAVNLLQAPSPTGLLPRPGGRLLASTAQSQGDRSGRK